MSNLFYRFHHSPIFKKMMPIRATYGEFWSAFATVTCNKSTLIENRGLHWTDKRLPISFVSGHPVCSLEELNNLYRAGVLTSALNKRKGKNIIKPREYLRNLRVRNMRGQILNPALRKDALFISRGELFRKSAMKPFARKFMNFLNNDNNADYAQKWALVG